VVVSWSSSLLTGVEASAAQNAPVTKLCSQCGAVLPSSVRACNFCDSAFPRGFHESKNEGASRPRENLALKASSGRGATVHNDQGPGWRNELEDRLDAYRIRRGQAAPAEAAQSRLPFGEPEEPPRSRHAVGLAEPELSADDDFSFTIAIGRYSPPNEKRDGRMMIDVSEPPSPYSGVETEADEEQHKRYGLYPVASIEERRLAAVIDGACLLFAYGGFLALFGSLGGQFTLSKLSAEVYATTLAIVYLQYFALFTVFGGTTPGMMFRGLQVASFSGEHPTPRQMLLRSLGYIISASTFFLGFFWAVWDEDALTWHDRISHTYLSSPETRAHANSPSVAASR
jgi:uncharacterized RDD family membrane protein YckC